MKHWLLTILLLSAPCSLLGQKTTVSATVRGTNGVPYVNCQFNVDFVPNPNLPAGTTYTYGGNPAFQTSYVGNKCDGFGNFQIQLPDNNVISPSTPYQSQWRFQFVSANGYLGGPYGCMVTVVITGSTQDISNNIEPLCPPLPQSGGGTVSGTPPHVAKFTTTTSIGDASGLDPGNTPTQWPLGLNVIGNAGYLQDTVGTAGVVANELVDFDSSGNIVVSAAGTNKPKGIADVGALVGGSVPRAVWGRHACVFDNQTTANDFVAPSATNAGQCSDVGPTKVNNATIIGTVVTVNTGAGTLANVDLLPWDTLAPGSSGGSGTVSACATANSNALFAIAGTVVSCDSLVTDDGNGNTTMKSVGFTDTRYAHFWFSTQGPTPPPAPANSTQFQVGTSIPTPNTFQLPQASGASDVGKAWGVSSATTDLNGNPVDIMGLITAGGGGGSSIRTCLVTIGDPGATSPVLANDNDSPAQCGNDIGSDLSIAGVACWADAGSPIVNPILTGGSSTSILSSPLTCGTASWAAGTINGTPALHTFSGNFALCSSPPCTLDANITTAGGTAKYIVLKFTASGAGGGGGGGGSGTVTSVAASVPAWQSISGSPVTTAGTLAFGVTVAGADYALTSTGANAAAWEQINSGSSCGDSTHAISYDSATHKFGCQTIAAGSGTATSVGLSLPSIFTVTGSPVTTSGTLTGTLNPPGADYLPTSTALNTVAWEQVNSGSSCGDSTHAISYDSTTHKFGCQAVSPGTVTSVAMTVPTGFAVSGSPVTTSGTLGVATSGLTTTKLQKAVTGGLGDSSITDDGTAVSTTESVTVGDLTDNGLTANKPVCTDGSKKLSSSCSGVPTARHVCMIVIGAENAAVALADTDIAPQGEQCQIPTAATILEIDVTADAGTPSVVVAKRHCTANPCASNFTVTDLLSSALATASSGGPACSNTGGTAGLDTFTTCSNTLQNTSIAVGDYIETHTATAGGTAKRMSISVTWTVN